MNSKVLDYCNELALADYGTEYKELKAEDKRNVLKLALNVISLNGVD